MCAPASFQVLTPEKLFRQTSAQISPLAFVSVTCGTRPNTGSALGRTHRRRVVSYYVKKLAEELSQVPVGDLSALKAMLHFDRTGKRFKPHLVIANPDLAPAYGMLPPPNLRVVR